MYSSNLYITPVADIRVGSAEDPDAKPMAYALLSVENPLGRVISIFKFSNFSISLNLESPVHPLKVVNGALLGGFLTG